MPSNELDKRTDEDRKLDREAYNSFRDELLKRQLSNTENYDKSILTLSSSGLAISLTFFKFVVPLEGADFVWLIKASWICFLVSIIISLVAYLVSNRAITKQLSIAESYYIDGNHSAPSQKNLWSKLNDWLNRIVGLIFGVAITAVVLFVILNINEESVSMSDEKVTSHISKPAMDSAAVPMMQRASSEGLAINSASIPTMQAAPSSSSQQSQSSPQAPQQTSSEKK